MTVGALKVTVTYTLQIHDLADYEAQTLEEAARTLSAWFAEGVSSVAEDLSCQATDTVVVEVAQGLQTHSSRG